MITLTDYATNPLNPALKLLVFFLFMMVVVVYWDTMRRSRGPVRSFLIMISLFAVFMAIGALLRYFGHGTEFGFSPEYSLKWFQSLMYCAAVACLLVAGKKLLDLFPAERTG
jgi:hypothetical protein